MSTEGLVHVQVLSSVSGCMANMHEAGFVHRDFKSTSIIFQQTSMQFVCIGFHAAERVGASRPHSFVLEYAAPEVVQFQDEHPGEQKALEASTAMDAWSMGVVCMELLTGGPVFDVVTHGADRVHLPFLLFSSMLTQISKIKINQRHLRFESVHLVVVWMQALRRL